MSHTQTLKKILEKAVISPMLRQAVQASIEALKAGDKHLACKLTACKSLVTGKIDPDDKRNAFQEDGDTNEKIFDTSVYSLLDGIHFNLAMELKEMPAGMSVYSSEGCQERPKDTGDHPVLQRMQEEHENIHREVEEMRRSK